MLESGLFLFIMGVCAVSTAHFFGGGGFWTGHLIKEALSEPLMITAAVFVMGFIIYILKKPITRFIVKIEHKLGSKYFAAFLIVTLGLLSSVLTAIMSAIILVEAVSALKLSKKYELKLVILGCFSIGLGAALTPIGEPLSTIAISKLKGEPFLADFFFLLKNIGVYVFPGIFLLGVLGYVIEPAVKESASVKTLSEKESETIKDIFVYSGKVYIFIVALVLLGEGFRPIVDKYIVRLPGGWLYWINSLSAVMDNATLAAAEISPYMTLLQIKYLLMGLLVAGGMLIPGNIPNIICAGRLKIKSKEWAKLGLPLGGAMM